jgi:hypothetical protein
MAQALFAAHSADTAQAVTTSDTAPNVFTRVYVGGAGNLKVTTENGDVVTFSAVPVGTVLPIRTSLIWATGTTATLIVGLK